MILGIAAGGTGGHIVPALHVAKLWMQQGGRCVWFGRKGSLEEEVALKNNILFVAQNAVKMRGPSIAKEAPRMAGAIWSACWQLRAHNVQAVFSTGAYVSFPTAIAAKILRLPLVIHEQNTYMGRANRLLSKFANRVCLGLPIAGLPKDWVTGNPTNIHKLDERPKHILVIGGSQGCQFFNECLPECFAQLNLTMPIVHLAGRDEKAVKALYSKYNIDADVHAYHHEMHTVYNGALLVIARSGAMTLAELSAYGLPSILVPYPHATNDHQRKNALYYVKKGAAKMSSEDSEMLQNVLQDLLSHPQQLSKMSSCMTSLAKPDASSKIIGLIQDHIHA